MPAQHTYPGVYVEEIPSGVHTISGVSTSDTAFVDFFGKGPVDRAVRITSWTQFDRVFGGLDTRSEGSYAVFQYYLNGGQVAWICRGLADTAKTASVTLQGSSPLHDVLVVSASSPGAWGNAVQVRVENVAGKGVFNLLAREVSYSPSGRQQVVASEGFLNLSMDKTSPRYVVDAVNASSVLIHVVEAASSAGAPPADTGLDASSAPAYSPLGQAPGTAGSDGDVPPTGPTAPVTAWTTGKGAPALQTAMSRLTSIAPYTFNLLCIPAASALEPNGRNAVLAAAHKLCEDKNAFLIVDLPAEVATPDSVVTWLNDAANPNLGRTNAAVYFPRLLVPDPLNDNRSRNVGPSGTLAGVYARTDSTRGVWKAPAGVEASLQGSSVASVLDDLSNGDLNIVGVNVLRNFPIFGNLSWGARTLRGADQEASEWKYIPVRRMALYLKESLYQGLKWVVFEPNAEPLWAQIRLNVGAFMHDLFRKGAFAGLTPRDAYLVKCDAETTTQTDVNNGIVNILVGFAPLKPAEFVVVQIEQLAGQIQV